MDEAVHLTAGYSYWKTGDFRLSPEHPPFAKLLASLPLLWLQPDFSPSSEAWEYRLQAQPISKYRLAVTGLGYAPPTAPLETRMLQAETAHA